MSEEVKDNDNHRLLARLDERTQSIQQILGTLSSEIKSNNEAIAKKVESVEARINTRMTDLERKLNERIASTNAELDANYVKKETFLPVKNIVYGAVAMILTGVFGALLTLVIIK